MRTAQKQKDTAFFFAISGSRLFWLTIFSLGLYQLYWFYKNWQALRNNGLKINPVIRAWIFPFFFAFPLFLNIKNKISPDRLTNICLWFAPCLFIMDSFLSFVMPDETISVWILAEIIVIILSAFTMMYIQKAINRYNSANNPQITLHHKPTGGEILTVLLVPMLILFSFIYGYTKAYNRYKNIIAIEEPQNFITAVTFKHLSVYPFVCEKQGYIMKNYQESFMRTYADEIEIYEQALHKQGLTIIEAWQKQPQNVIDFIISLTFQELEDIRTNMNETAAEITGNIKNKNSLISSKEACIILDKKASGFFEKNSSLKKAIQIKIKTL